MKTCPGGAAHPLRERIWDVERERFIDEHELVTALRGRRHVLLGEKHDNPRHHRLQARVLAALVRSGRRPAVAWEMITAAEADALAAFTARGVANAAGFGPAVSWEQRGWGPWAHYQPIAEVALAAKLPQLPAGIARGTLARLHGGGGGAGAATKPDALPTVRVDLPPAALRDLQRSIRVSHCGHATPALLKMMTRAQQLRDTKMAQTMLGADEAAGAVLIAGAVHVRRDRGTPFYLRAQGVPPSQIGALSFVETEAGACDPRRYAARVAPDLPQRFGFLWFTDAVDNQDPCEQFKEALKRMRERAHRRAR